jgi:hypothetical protein
MAIVAYWPGTLALGIIFFFFSPSSHIENISVSGQYSKIIRRFFFYNNRRSAANSFPRFAYSFVVLMLRQYYWWCDSYSANRRSAANIKKSAKNFVLALQICSASPIDAASVPPLRLLAPKATQRQ